MKVAIHATNRNGRYLMREVSWTAPNGEFHWIVAPRAREVRNALNALLSTYGSLEITRVILGTNKSRF